MASPAPTPSTPDLIQASRPGFPKGLRVRQQDRARTLLGRGRATLARHRPEGRCSVLHVRERAERYRLVSRDAPSPVEHLRLTPRRFDSPDAPPPNAGSVRDAGHRDARRGEASAGGHRLRRYVRATDRTVVFSRDQTIGRRCVHRGSLGFARARGARADARRAGVARRVLASSARAETPRDTPALQIGAFARHASPRHVAPPLDPPALSGRTRMWEWHTIHLARMPSARSTRRRIFFSFRRSGFFSTKRKNAFGRRRAFWSR